MITALESRGHRLNPEFYDELHVIDPACDAVYDDHEDAVIVWAKRAGGVLQHELTLHREPGENYGPLGRRTLKKLKECDVWKRFKNADEFDRYLEEKAKNARDVAAKDAKRERLAKIKDEMDFVEAAVWNAQHGRYTKETAQPYETGKSTGTKKGGIKKLEDLD